MKTNNKNVITRTTRIFIVAGIFLPAFTIAAALGLQMLINSCGIECSKAWRILWVMTAVGCVTLPVICWHYIQKNYKGLLLYKNLQKLQVALVVFNIMEYACIQVSIGLIFISGETLCYVTDGQLGLEFVPAAWCALPILHILSFIYQKELDKLIKKDTNI